MAVHKRGGTGWYLALIVLLVVLAAVFVSVLRLRLSTGEAYPPYSSMRADPLGARAFYESLNRLNGIECERNFKALNKLQGHSGETLLLLNLHARAYDRSSFIDGRDITRFAVDGGRVVITLDPSAPSSRRGGEFDDEWNPEEKKAEKGEKEGGAGPAKGDAKKAKDDSKPEEKKAGKGKAGKEGNGKGDSARDSKKDGGEKDDDEKKDKRPLPLSLEEALKLDLQTRTFTLKADGGSKLDLKPGFPLAAADTPEWFSNLFVEPAKEGGELWQVLAAKGDRAMIVERRFGAGSVVVCTDTFFVSNESLWKEPKAVFLAWLLGDAKKVIFDERHFGGGIGEEPGIMTLARRYRMHGLFIGGLLLFALFVWRNTSSLVPPDLDADLGLGRSGAVSGQGAASGLVSLLRRGIPASALLQKCFEVWTASRSAAESVPTERRNKAAELLKDAASRPGAWKQAPSIYQQVRDTLHPPRRH